MGNIGVFKKRRSGIAGSIAMKIGYTAVQMSYSCQDNLIRSSKYHNLYIKRKME